MESMSSCAAMYTLVGRITLGTPVLPENRVATLFCFCWLIQTRAMVQIFVRRNVEIGTR